MQRRGAVEEHRMVGDDLIENVPDLGPEPIVSLWKPRRIARSRSFTPANRAIRTSLGSMS